MKIVFLPSALDDLKWMKRYYHMVFPAGKPKAAIRFRNALDTIRDNPKAGAPCEIVEGLREHPIPNTPFTLIYHPMKAEIRILHIRDQRSNKSLTRPY